jgi:hypothetical protein
MPGQEADKVTGFLEKATEHCASPQRGLHGVGEEAAERVEAYPKQSWRISSVAYPSLASTLVGNGQSSAAWDMAEGGVGMLPGGMLPGGSLLMSGQVVKGLYAVRVESVELLLS